MSKLQAYLQLGAAVAVAQAVMEEASLAKFGLVLDGTPLAVANAAFTLLFTSLLRMVTHDTASSAADRQAMKAFIFVVITLTSAFMLKSLVGELIATLPVLVPATWRACALTHLGIAFGGFLFSMLVGFLPTDPPPKRGSSSDTGSSSAVYVYILHFSELLNAATMLPMGFAWNQLKNDLFALLPIPATATYSSTAVTVLIQLSLCVLLASGKVGIAWANGTSLAKTICPPDVAVRHLFLQNKMLEYMQAWAIYDILATIWRPVTLSPCSPSTFPVLIPGSSPWAPALVLLVILGLAVLFALNPPPERLAGSLVLGLALGLLVATLPIQLGWAFKDTYVGIVDFFLPSNPHLGNLTLIGALLSVLAVLLAIDACCTKKTGSVMIMA